MTDIVESRGRTADEAIAEALLQLGARREEVEVEILEEPQKGVLGLFGGRPARVRVRRKGVPAGGREADAAVAEPRGPDESSTRERAPDHPSPERVEGVGAGETAASLSSGPGSQPGPVAAVDVVSPLREGSPDDPAAVLEKLTTDLLRRAGFPSRCEVKPGDYWQVKVTTDEASAGMLIGRHGATIDAIEHLIERMASQATGGRVNMNFDINNYRRRREDRLVQRGQEAAQRVKRDGREIHFEAMSARERRIIHMEVAQVPGLRTFTVADESGKHVVVATADAAPPDEQDDLLGWEPDRGFEPPDGGSLGETTDGGSEGRAKDEAAPLDGGPDV
jgi:spoIIIJ-associated protein